MEDIRLKVQRQPGRRDIYDKRGGEARARVPEPMDDQYSLEQHQLLLRIQTVFVHLELSHLRPRHQSNPTPLQVLLRIFLRKLPRQLPNLLSHLSKQRSRPRSQLLTYQIAAEFAAKYESLWFFMIVHLFKIEKIKFDRRDFCETQL